MTTAADVVAEARTWLGTPFAHQGRVKGEGVDCIGLVIGVIKACGLAQDQEDVADYPRVPDGRLVLGLRRSPYIRKVSLSDRSAADIALITWSRVGQHIGILTAPNRMIHAIESTRPARVVETTLGGSHLRGLRAIYRLTELE